MCSPRLNVVLTSGDLFPKFGKIIHAITISGGINILERKQDSDLSYSANMLQISQKLFQTFWCPFPPPLCQRIEALLSSFNAIPSLDVTQGCQPPGGTRGSPWHFSSSPEYREKFPWRKGGLHDIVPHWAPWPSQVQSQISRSSGTAILPPIPQCIVGDPTLPYPAGVWSNMATLMRVANSILGNTWRCFFWGGGVKLGE